MKLSRLGFSFSTSLFKYELNGPFNQTLLFQLGLHKPQAFLVLLGLYKLINKQPLRIKCCQLYFEIRQLNRSRVVELMSRILHCLDRCQCQVGLHCFSFSSLVYWFNLHFFNDTIYNVNFTYFLIFLTYLRST